MYTSFNWSILGTDLLSSIAYLTIVISTIYIFISKKITFILLIIALLLGITAERINLLGAILITLVFIIFYTTSKVKNNLFKTLLTITSIVITYAYLLHLVPGYNNWPVISNKIISTGGIPYTMYFNFDKPIIGIITGIFLFSSIKRPIDYKKLIKSSVLILLSALLIVLF